MRLEPSGNLEKFTITNGSRGMDDLFSVEIKLVELTYPCVVGIEQFLVRNGYVRRVE